MDMDITFSTIDDDDMAWAKLLVDGARRAVARGDISSLEEAERDIDRTLAALGH